MIRNPQQEYAQRFPLAPRIPKEWLSLSDGVRNIEHLPNGLVKYEISVLRNTWLGRLLLLEEWRVRVMDEAGNIIVDEAKS